MYETYPQYVEAEPEPENRLRAESYNDLTSKRSEHPDRDSGRTFDYYVIDPTHSVTRNAAEKNICDPEDEDDKRVYTLAFLAPHLLAAHGHEDTLASLTNVKNPGDRLEDDERVFYEWKRARAKIIPDESRWSVESDRTLTMHRADEAVIQATRVALHKYYRNGFQEQEMNAAESFGIQHVRHVFDTVYRRKGIDVDELSEHEVADLVKKKTCHPRMPHRQAFKDIILYMKEHDALTPEDESQRSWCVRHGYKKSEWSNVSLRFEGMNLYDADRVKTLRFGDDLREAYEDALGETFPQWRCGGCGQTFQRRAKRTRHIREGNCPVDSSTQLHCEFCDEVFEGDTAPKAMASHAAKGHPELDRLEARRDIDKREKYTPRPAANVEETEEVEEETELEEVEDVEVTLTSLGQDFESELPETTTVDYVEAESLLPDGAGEVDMGPTEAPGEVLEKPTFDITDEVAHEIEGIVLETLADGNVPADVVRALLADADESEREEVLLALMRSDVSNEALLELREAMD